MQTQRDIKLNQRNAETQVRLNMQTGSYFKSYKQIYLLKVRIGERLKMEQLNEAMVTSANEAHLKKLKQAKKKKMKEDEDGSKSRHDETGTGSIEQEYRRKQKVKDEH